VRAIVVLVCLSVGVIPLLSLNGQTFTNSLIALPFFLIPIVLCAATALDPRTPNDQKRAWRLAPMLMALLAIGILLNLPSAFRFQEGFNRAVRQARTGKPDAVKPVHELPSAGRAAILRLGNWAEPIATRQPGDAHAVTHP